MEPCAGAMDAVAAEIRGPAADLGPAVRAHLAGCPRCRAAYAHAAACAPWIRAAIAEAGGAVAEASPDAAPWERALFLRLLAEERESGRAGLPPEPGALPTRARGPAASRGPAGGAPGEGGGGPPVPAGAGPGPRPRNPAWARLAAWLGGAEAGSEEGEWRRWRRGPEADASPR